jgi:hypothetical protein
MSNAEAHTNLGILLAHEGNTNDAIAHFSQAVTISPGNKVAQQYLANLKSKSLATQ